MCGGGACGRVCLRVCVTIPVEATAHTTHKYTHTHTFYIKKCLRSWKCTCSLCKANLPRASIAIRMAAGSRTSMAVGRSAGVRGREHSDPKVDHRGSQPGGGWVEAFSMVTDILEYKILKNGLSFSPVCYSKATDDR